MSKRNRSNKPTIPGRTHPISPAPQQQAGGQQIHFQQHVQTIFDPEVIRKYGEIMPGAPERILVILEKNNETERVLREKQADSEIEVNRLQAKDNQRRDWMAYSIVAGGFLISAYFAYLGLIWLTGGTLSAIAVAVVNGFLNHKMPQIGSKTKAPKVP